MNKFTIFCLALLLSTGTARTEQTQDEKVIIEKYKTWKEIVNNPKNPDVTLSFFIYNPNWPMFEKLTKIAESQIKVLSETTDKWFSLYKPSTPNGLVMYSKTLLKRNRAEGIKYINQVWVYQRLKLNFAATFRKTFKNEISLISDAKRIVRLSLSKKYDQIKNMRNLVCKTIAQYINQYMFNGKAAYQKYDVNDADSRYDAAKALTKKNNVQKAAQILSASNANEEDNATKFFKLRREVACNVARAGHPLLAYDTISKHSLNRAHPKQKSNYVKAEWFSGFIAFRFLDNKHNGLKHFKNAYNSSKDSLHKGKNAFWIAEVYMAMNDTISAFDWYKTAANYHDTFYGILANERLHSISVKRFVSYREQQSSTLSKNNFDSRELVTVLKTLVKYNIEKDIKYLTPFYKELIDEIDSPAEEELLLQLASSDAEREFIILENSKKQMYLSNRKTFKKLDSKDLHYVEDISKDACFISLVHSIIKRESFFKPNAVSHVGASGLMQIMPSTAAYEVKRIKFYTGGPKVSLFNKRKNIIIGSSILDRLLKKYKGNLIYVMAAYNAGEGNVAKFRKSIKNLQNLTSLDTIELIPFKETRLYVKHVLYNMFIYQQIFDAPKSCYNCKFISALNL